MDRAGVTAEPGVGKLVMIERKVYAEAPVAAGDGFSRSPGSHAPCRSRRPNATTPTTAATTPSPTSHPAAVQSGSAAGAGVM